MIGVSHKEEGIGIRFLLNLAVFVRLPFFQALNLHRESKGRHPLPFQYQYQFQITEEFHFRVHVEGFEL